jgi:Family of unknown function (DUF5677)
MAIQITDNGFLDSNSSEVALHTNLVHREVLSYCKRLNNLAHRSLFSAKFSIDDSQQFLLAALMHKAMTAYQAIILLAERGMPSESQVVLRTLLEITFRIVAIAKNSEVGEAYIQQDETNRKKFINKLKLLEKSRPIDIVDCELDSMLKTVSQGIKDKNIKELNTAWFAEKANLLDFYNSAYAVLSNSVHVNVRHLENAFNLDCKGELIGLNYGFSDKDLIQNVLTAAESLLLSLRAAYSIIDIEPADEIHLSHDEFNLLMGKYNNA